MMADEPFKTVARLGTAHIRSKTEGMEWGKGPFAGLWVWITCINNEAVP